MDPWSTFPLVFAPFCFLAQGRTWVVDGPPVVDSGSATILFLDAAGSVHGRRRLPASGLSRGDGFGTGLASLGDLNGDGTSDLAIGTPEDEFHPSSSDGVVEMFFLDGEGGVLSRVAVERGSSSFKALGRALASLGDLDGDGVTDLAVGALGGDSKGALRILFLNPDGSLKAGRTIGSGTGGFAGTLDVGDDF